MVIYDYDIFIWRVCVCVCTRSLRTIMYTSCINKKNVNFLFFCFFFVAGNYRIIDIFEIDAMFYVMCSASILFLL